MRRWMMNGAITEVILLVWLMTAPAAIAAPAVTGGARAGAGGGEARLSTLGSAVNAIPTSFQEISAAFTATPTVGSLGDAMEASRATFSTAEPIEFDAVLFESGLAGTTVTLQLFLLDSNSGLAIGAFSFSGVAAASDRTGFFIQLGPGSLPAGRLKWLMVISDAFGHNFITPYQTVDLK